MTKYRHMKLECCFLALLVLAGFVRCQRIGNNITLRVGLSGGPPFHFPGQQNPGIFRELLELLQGFAAIDNINLTFIMEVVPHPKYNAGPNVFFLAAKNCREVDVVEDKEDCDRYDIIVAPLIASTSRFELADLTPSWMETYVTANRYTGTLSGSAAASARVQGKHIFTFAEADRYGGTICALAGAAYTELVMDRYPNAIYNLCSDRESCHNERNAGNCSLVAGLSIFMEYEAEISDYGERTKDVFARRFLVWPMKYELDPEIRNLIKRWMYMAVQSTVVDQIVKKHLDPKTCPLGYAGDTCEDLCDPDHGQSDQQGRCVCDSTKWSGEDCSIEVMEDVGMIARWQRRLGYAMFGVNVSIVVVCAIWLVLNRSKAEVIVAQPIFLGLILVGCLISSSTILALMQEETEGKDGTVSCMLIPWLYSIGFSITFGTLFTKIVRVHRLVKAASRMRRIQITLYSALKWIFLVLFVDVVLLVLWQVTAPLKWERTVTMADKYGDALSSVGTCKSEHLEIFGSMLLTFHLVLMMAGSYICYETRTVPEKLSGARSTSVAMVSNLQIILVGLPLLLLVGSDPDTSFILRSTFLWMNDLLVVVVIFGNLIFYQEISPELTARDIIHESITTYISRRSARRASNDFNEVFSNIADIQVDMWGSHFFVEPEDAMEKDPEIDPENDPLA